MLVRTILCSMFLLELGCSTTNSYSTTLTPGQTLRAGNLLFQIHPSFIIITLVFLAIRKGSTRADLSVAIKPLLHHLGDQRMVAPARALLHGHQDPSFCHTAVQPLPKQLFLLFLVTYLQGERENRLRMRLEMLTATFLKSPSNN